MSNEKIKTALNHLLSENSAKGLEIIENLISVKASELVESTKAKLAKSALVENSSESEDPLDPDAALNPGKTPELKESGWENEKGVKHEVGHDVEIHPAHDRWMMGDRHGLVVKKTPTATHIKMHRSGKTIKVHPNGLVKNHTTGEKASLDEGRFENMAMARGNREHEQTKKFGSPWYHHVSDHKGRHLGSIAHSAWGDGKHDSKDTHGTEKSHKTKEDAIEHLHRVSPHKD